MLTLSSCGIVAEEYADNATLSVVVTDGIRHDYYGNLWYYEYNGLYYYPIQRDGFWYLMPHRRIYPYGYNFHFTTTPRDRHWRFTPYGGKHPKPHQERSLDRRRNFGGQHYPTRPARRPGRRH